ncbi:MAG: anti-sigma factor family protein [Armatimonadota bacterium]
MACGIDLERISALVDGELKPEEEAELRAHLAECGACSAELASLRSVKAAAVRMADAVRVPRGFWRGVSRRLDEIDRPAAAPQRWAVRPLPVVAAAAVVLVVATALSLWMTPTQPTVPLAGLAQDFAGHQALEPTRFHAVDRAAIRAALSSEFGGRPAVMADFPEARASLKGCRICACSGVPAVAQVYGTRYGPVALYQAMGESVELPREALAGTGAGRRLYASSADGCNIVAWRYGDLVVALVGEVSVPDLVSMAQGMVPAADAGI